MPTKFASTQNDKIMSFKSQNRFNLIGNRFLHYLENSSILISTYQAQHNDSAASISYIHSRLSAIFYYHVENDPN